MAILDTFYRFYKRLSDNLFEGKNRTAIIMGTDRKNIKESGYGDGGQNRVESGTIDLVVGYGNNASGDPDYINDKSRIYISGLTDPDDYFGVSRGTNIKEAPAVIIFSDNSYVVARKIVKILTPKNHIILKDNGDIEISSDGDLNINSAKNVNLNSTENINLNTNQGVGGRIITENDICVGPDSTGAPVVCSFLAIPLGAVINNSKVKIS